MEENKKHPSQIIHGFLMADDRKQKEDVPILTHPLLLLVKLCNFLPFFGFLPLICTKSLTRHFGR